MPSTKTRPLLNTALPLLALVLAAPSLAVAEGTPPEAAGEPPQQASQPVAPQPGSTDTTSAPAAPPAETGAQQNGPSKGAPPEVKRVVYIPETLKAEITEQIRKEVMERAKEEGWAAPNQVPPWMARLKFSGDVRLRFDRATFPSGNGNTGQFPNFAAINAGSPADVRLVDLTSLSYINVDQDRTRSRVMARLGVEAELAPPVTAGLRLASGDSNIPVSANQTLGASGGDFSKYAAWIDRAFIRVGSREGTPAGLDGVIGRFGNPFFSTQLIYAEYIDFDGAALQGWLSTGQNVSWFATGGAFPIYSTAFAYPSIWTAKLPSSNKWLFAGQFGGEWRGGRNLGVKLGVAYYDFYGIEGRASSPCDTNIKGIACDTDDTRPSYAQMGNTYFPLRTPSAAALIAEASPATSRYQYFGLASAFRELVGTARVDVPVGDSLKASLDGEAVVNTGFSKSRVAAVAINNLNGCVTACGAYGGGNVGYLTQLTLASGPQLVKGSWSAWIGYRAVESDAVVDAFNDADFGEGGTNLKGFLIGARVAAFDGLSAMARFMSADSIAGPPYRCDVLQVDIQARF